MKEIIQSKGRSQILGDSINFLLLLVHPSDAVVSVCTDGLCVQKERGHSSVAEIKETSADILVNKKGRELCVVSNVITFSMESAFVRTAAELKLLKLLA